MPARTIPPMIKYNPSNEAVIALPTVGCRLLITKLHLAPEIEIRTLFGINHRLEKQVSHAVLSAKSFSTEISFSKYPRLRIDFAQRKPLTKEISNTIKPQIRGSMTPVDSVAKKTTAGKLIPIRWDKLVMVAIIFVFMKLVPMTSRYLPPMGYSTPKSAPGFALPPLASPAPSHCPPRCSRLWHPH